MRTNIKQFNAKFYTKLHVYKEYNDFHLKALILDKVITFI